MKKVILALIAVAIIVAVVVVILMGNKMGNKKATFVDFGQATVKSMGKGKNVIACDDAKLLMQMAEHLGKAGSDDDFAIANLELEIAMRSFNLSLIKQYKDNATKRDAAFASIDEGLNNIYQAAALANAGGADNKTITEYIDVTFCGAKPTANYVSPFAAAAPMGTEPTDNTTAEPIVKEENTSSPH